MYLSKPAARKVAEELAEVLLPKDAPSLTEEDLQALTQLVQDTLQKL